ncbi:MAG: ABC-2 type transport system permease protein [Mariniblastus sp.]|jgi:ABC-2 type transport system permease protein
MLESAFTWWTFFKISINERLVYRADFMLGTLMRFLPTLTQIFLWWAIYDVISTAGSADTAGGLNGEIAGYKYGDMVAYYLLVIISRAFSSMPGLTSGIANQIRNGEIKKFLIQPVDMQGCLLMQRIAHKLVYYLIATLPFALVFYMCGDFFVDGWPGPDVLCVFFLSLIFSFLLGFFLESCIGLIGFWFLEVTSLTFIYMLLNFLLSGHMFPLELLPSEPYNIRGLVEFLPFKYLAYFPAAVFLGKVEGPEMYRGLMVEISWVIFFIVLSRVLWWKGIKRYSGYGG